ncbi:chemotaxis protein CheB [Zoogloea sp.]|uniref:chemotaxis protein CheB n=1 Tax=Zoogloea sp. TaxID=49181 RepID=UPI001AC241E6|nr:chemotaxis protein CheB [Zoogloea sp.]MBN8282155.1 PAS domain-containing protein [Zoogloea sp.]
MAEFSAEGGGLDGVPAEDEVGGGGLEGESPGLLTRNYIVGVGASAGGLEALSGLFSSLPTDLGATYVVVQHLSPTYRSMLVQLIGRETAMEVKEVEQHESPSPNTVYITPPNRNLLYRDGRFELIEPIPNVLPKPSVNSFFYSVAAERGEEVIGVILSGTGSDGAGGVRAIKAGGGLVFAQDPASAKYAGMPQSAIETDCVDWVLTPDAIAREIALIVRTQGLVDPPEKLRDAPGTIQSLLTRVQRYTRIDFSGYKENTVWRRILRRMATNRVESLQDYIDLTERNPEELGQLSKEILISVTSFFRDRDAFDALAAAMCERLAVKRPGDEIRVWVPGCATGEEAYAIAILISEYLGAALSEYTVQIFATDIDMSAMAIARRGVYSAASLGEVDAAIVQKYFITAGDAYEVVKPLRELVVFARQDLVQDPPFVRLDLVSCRNVLIYFQNPLQERVLGTFHYALAPAGLLFLGKSESVFQHEDLFDTVHRDGKIFRRSGLAARAPLGPMRQPLRSRPPERERRNPADVLLHTLAEAYAPPSLLVNQSFEILHVFGEVNRVLGIPSGRPDFNLLGLIRKEFRTELQTLLHQVRQKGGAISGRPRLLDVPGVAPQQLRMHLWPVSVETDGDAAIVSFETVVEQPSGNDLPSGELNLASRDLEEELIATREHLQTVVEELETSNEETQALNEELQASNEELQAANEELQAANEELQSTNEELTTVNEELQIKSAELADANADLENVQNSFGFCLLVVSEQMRVLRFNEVAARYFGLNDSATGEHVRIILAQQKLDAHTDLIEQVVRDGRPLERQVSDALRHYLLRVSPRAVARSTERGGAVITLIDETHLLETQCQLRNSEQRMTAIMENAFALISVKDTLGRYEYVNSRFKEYFRTTAEDLIGRTDFQLLPDDMARQIRERDLAVLASGRSVESEETMTLPDGEHTFLVLRFGLLSHDGVVAGLCTKSTDITDRKRREAVLIQREAFLREALTVIPAALLLEFDAAEALVRSVGDLGREHLDGLQAGVPMVSVLERLGLSCVEGCAGEGPPVPSSGMLGDRPVSLRVCHAHGHSTFVLIVPA